MTGSYNDQDNDFEVIISFADKTSPGSENQYTLLLADVSSENSLIWQTAQPTLLSGLNAIDEFIIENNITLYSKILTSPVRDKAVDKELEGFILNRLEY